jgi:hypothetical protein
MKGRREGFRGNDWSFPLHNEEEKIMPVVMSVRPCSAPSWLRDKTGGSHFLCSSSICFSQTNVSLLSH